ncbi:MAG: nitroreductase [Vicingaceae bacterium]|jgi:nitroreductase
MRTIEDLKWRYATKKFDATKKISNEDLDKLKEAIQLTATSYGLQLFKVLIIENPDTRNLLKPASWGQSQITDASHLLVFCNFSEVTEDHLNHFAAIKSKANNIPMEDLSGYVGFIQSKLGELNADQIDNWTAKQTYIGLANLMNAAAELHIDTCPMEGFDKDQYNEILGLSEKGLSAAVLCPIGYRSEDDASQHSAKVRKSVEDLFEVV